MLILAYIASALFLVVLFGVFLLSVSLNWRYLATLETERRQYRQAFYLQNQINTGWVEAMTEPPPLTWSKKPKEPPVPVAPLPPPAAALMAELRKSWSTQDDHAFEVWRDETYGEMPVDDAKALLDWFDLYGEKTPLAAFAAE